MNDGRIWRSILVSCGCGFLGAGAVAAGQNKWLFDISYSDPAGVINSPDDTATMTLLAAFNPECYAFGRGRMDASADDPLDSGFWSDPLALLRAPGWDSGTIDGEFVTGIVVHQLHAIGGYYADPSNPIAVWTATWQTLDLSPRNVELHTATGEFGLYVDFGGNWADVGDTVEEGFKIIRVVPSPGALPPLLVLAAMGRRKRTSL